MFGKKRDERVLLLDQPVLLMALRLRVAHWHRSEYKVYKPHVATAHVQPETIRFEGLALWYGTKRIVYPLRGGDHGPDDAGDLGGRGEGAPG
jgi:hypothetical protein